MSHSDSPCSPTPTVEPGSTVAGILNIDKPQGLTSHDVVARVRRLTGERRVGHAGTLDPMATGVLLVCLGQATRIIEYLPDDKSYRATIRFGTVTDTWDAEGQVVEEYDVAGPTRDDIVRVLPRFTGRITQVPPMYSALKHQGQPLYRLARQGIDVEREPRQVVIYRLELLEWRHPDLVLRVDCSGGTYIRSLAYDLGRILGLGAHLAALVRLAVGGFRVDDAVSLPTLLEAQTGTWRRYLLPIELGLRHMPGVRLDDSAVQRLRFGQAIPLDASTEAPLLCAHDQEARLVAILAFDAETGLWKPHKVLAS